ncbi:MAG: glycosyltransferase family 2 protein [Anaerolineae bacterium]|jgi:cellulose synthase/poly-beta-1,6-N-acetylglucosamine synthase-like glycosyltransferase|nr:glycosyltransferase family 2 protein [Anaerolineae bacterium]
MIGRITAVILAAYALLVAVRAVARGRRVSAAPRWQAPPDPPVWPFVSVIIPAWKDRATLLTCLDTVAALDYPNYEAIVVAGGGDGTYTAALDRAASDARLRVVEQLPKGKNAALNQGLECARGEVITFLDADSEVEAGWLKALVRRVDGAADAVSGNYLPLRETPVSLLGDVAKVAEYEVRGRVILQGSGGIALRRDTLVALGRFPETRVSSDWDLDARAGVAGYRKAFAPDAVVRTHRPATLREWWQNELRWRRLHLLSLFRLRGELLADPRAAARHLFPYALAWGVAGSAALALIAALFARGPARRAFRSLALLIAGGGLLRELAAPLEVIAYRPQRRLLAGFAFSPLLTALGWAACIVASVTPRQVKLQFKGARQK